MNRDEVMKALVEILAELQELVRDVAEDSENISEITKPVGGLRQFDSLTGVEASVMCFERFEIPEKKRVKVQSLFVGDDHEGRPYALTVGEVVERIMALKKK